MDVKEILPPEWKITSVHLYGGRSSRAKALLWAEPDTPLIPINRMGVIKGRHIPMELGLNLIREIIDAQTMETLKTVARRLYLYDYEFITYTIPTDPPIELIVLKTTDNRLIINAVEHPFLKTKKTAFYTSLPITKRMLIYIITPNLYHGKQL